MDKENSIEGTPTWIEYEFFIANGCGTSSWYSSRATIKPSHDISWTIPCLLKEIENCDYIPETNKVTFCFENSMVISVEPDSISIDGANEASLVDKTMDWLNMLLDCCCKKKLNTKGELTLIWEHQNEREDKDGPLCLCAQFRP